MKKKLVKTDLKTSGKHTVVEVNNYERYWSDSTPWGHQIRVVKQNGDTIEINCRWPEEYNPRNKPITVINNYEAEYTGHTNTTNIKI